jgi:hypothetical protein
MIYTLIRAYKPVKELDEPAIFTMYSYFPLNEAVLCAECENVYSQKQHRQCPSCTSDVQYPIRLGLYSEEQRELINPEYKKNNNMKGVTIQ